jgi:hypothetical protein
MAQVKSPTDGLEIARLGRHDWRAVDTLALQSDPARIVGFIERIGKARYEVLWMTEPPRWAYVTSLQSAIDAIVAGGTFDGYVESNRIDNDRIFPRLPFVRRNRRRSVLDLQLDDGR